VRISGSLDRDPSKGIRSLLPEVIIDILLLVSSSVLFWLSFPNIISTDGNLFPLAFIAIVPVFIVVHRSSWIRIFAYAIFYAFITFAFFNYWLSTFHPVALITVQILASMWFLLLFPALKLIDEFFPNYGYLFQAFAWIAYEYLRTLGFLGYSYGILGYSQYLFLPFARLASLTGVWGVSFLLVFPQALVAYCVKDGIDGARSRFPTHLPIFIGYVFVFCASLVYGGLSVVDFGSSRSIKVALIQQNSDPWKDDRIEEYEQTLDSLIDLSKQSLSQKPEIVIWSETAFVLAIEYHLKYRESQDAVRVVRKLTDFLDTQSIPYVVGNDEGVKIRIGTPEEKRIDYNAALLFEGSRIVDVYRKVHLVPFTEHFPYKDIFPFVYDILIRLDTHFWEKGTKYTVFDAAGFRFSTPICFEDTFGYLARRFCNEGAQVLVNLTNDTWSGSVVAEVQHMAMAVFRAIENKRSMVRSTNSGITCAIDPNGLVTAKLPPFEKAYLVADIPVYTAGSTLYSKWGDWFAMALLGATFAGICVGMIIRVRKSATKN
jgi:apolipoprotein N-acyltransferase